MQIRSQGIAEPVKFELYYRESSKTRPITYELEIDEDPMGRPYVKQERLRQRVEKRGWPLSFYFFRMEKDTHMKEKKVERTTVVGA